MRVPPLLVSVCLLTAVSSADRTRRQSGSSCRDFAGRSGTCGPLRQCPALLRLVSAGRPLSALDIQNLRRSRCGTRRGQPLLCCAQVSATPSVTPSVTPSGPQLPPGISSGFSGSPEQHPNRPIVERGFQCGTEFSERIIGGTEVPIGKYPWVALLGYRDRGAPVTYSCGGSLISQQHVLTAAHCVTNLPAGFVLTTVRLGEYNLDQAEDCQRQRDGSRKCNSPQDFRIARTMVHSGYNRPIANANDIALLKLDRPVVEDQFVGKICLPFGAVRQRSYTGVSLTVAGFGRTGPNQFSPSSSVLLEVQLPVVGQQACDSIIRSQEASQRVGPLQICAGGQQGRDSCGGDSGGPVIAATSTGPPYSLIGVVSFGAARCGSGGIPSVNTRVSEYLNWILDRVDG